MLSNLYIEHSIHSLLAAGLISDCFLALNDVKQCAVLSPYCFVSTECAKKRTILPRCMQCLHATRSSHEKAVCPSFCLSNAYFVTKRKKVVPTIPTFLYHMKDHPSFVTRRMVGGDDLFYLKFRVKLTTLERKRRRGGAHKPKTAVFHLNCTSLEESLLQSLFV